MTLDDLKQAAANHLAVVRRRGCTHPHWAIRPLPASTALRIVKGQGVGVVRNLEVYEPPRRHERKMSSKYPWQVKQDEAMAKRLQELDEPIVLHQINYSHLLNTTEVVGPVERPRPLTPRVGFLDDNADYFFPDKNDDW